MRQLLSSLILHGKITTTEARAKFLKREVERFISRSKKLDLVARRRVLALLPEKEAARKFWEQIVPQFKKREGGYVRVVKLPHRRGDNAPMARIEFVEEIKAVKSEKKEETAGEKKAAKGKQPVKTAGTMKKVAKKINAKNKSNKSKRS